MARVYRYYNYPEALRVKELLESRGIPAEIHSFEEWGYDGVMRAQMGMGEIVVPDSVKGEAETLIREFIQHERGQ